ncbi:alpha/beta fold hydrolase [Fibrella aquatica]|jgi:pimeloyl-ACP methyl ester carboxylesterase|uniref:alpha/beta fold hydrolase n=1 Tax=Fibrella aquatica TaxID=3242487 RepID=UPI003522D934
MPRLIYIHGYVEDASIFDKLIPLLPTESIVKLDLETDFARWNPKDSTVNVSTLATYLVNTYQISPSDVVIGHSMGGWIAANLKAQTGCRAVLIAGFTDQKKIITYTRNMTVVKWLVKLGVVQSPWLARYALRIYRFDDSRALHEELVERLMSQSRRYIYQQLRVLLAPYPVAPAEPDLRIHARPDPIIRYPDEPCTETPGDHFNLAFHTDLVAKPILALLVGVGQGA